MVIWMLIGVGCIAICAAIFFIEWKFCVDINGEVAAPIIGFVGGAILIICPLIRAELNHECNAYIRQKAYIEKHVAANAAEDAGLTSKKIELNDWLYSAQLRKIEFGAWSLYPDVVVELEPIE